MVLSQWGEEVKSCGLKLMYLSVRLTEERWLVLGVTLRGYRITSMSLSSTVVDVKWPSASSPCLLDFPTMKDCALYLRARTSHFLLRLLLFTIATEG